MDSGGFFIVKWIPCQQTEVIYTRLVDKDVPMSKIRRNILIITRYRSTSINFLDGN